MSATPRKSKVASVSVPKTPAITAGAAIHPVPTNVSAPPAGWVEPAKLGRKGRRPKNGLTHVASTLSAELRTNAVALVEEIGPKVVDPHLLADSLDQAYAWEKAEEKASSFRVYVKSQRNAAWDAALTLMAGLRLGAKFAQSRDASFADRFPEVAKVFAKTRRPKKTAATAATVAGAKAMTASAKKKAAAAATQAAETATMEATPQEAATKAAPNA